MPGTGTTLHSPNQRKGGLIVDMAPGFKIDVFRLKPSQLQQIPLSRYWFVINLSKLGNKTPATNTPYQFRKEYLRNVYKFRKKNNSPQDLFMRDRIHFSREMIGKSKAAATRASPRSAGESDAV